MKKWTAILILGVSQFVMVLDSTVMNVSISTVASDLSTTISGMQAAITLYALTMAAFMLTGGKLGDKWGRRRAFVIGCVIYGIGSLITALSPNLGFLLFGWSFVEGIGAILVIPAIAALAAVNYKGKDRIVAFSILGAVTGIAAAVGPLIGGLVTTYFSWRYVFVSETLVMIIVLMLASKINDHKNTAKTVLDIPSSLLSAGGMGLLVFGVLQSKTWGWITPLNSPSINGKEIAPLGISLVAYLILSGIIVLLLFVQRQKMLEQTGQEPLLKIPLLLIPALRSGLLGFMSQYFAIAALFFVIPVYLQTILGYDALETGIKLVPLSIGLVLFSVIGSKLTVAKSAKYISRSGQLSMSFGLLLVLISIQSDLRGSLFWVGMFVVGAGFGLLASQLGNVNMSSVSKDDTSVVGGLQGTFQNLGSSFGTAIVGSIFMLMLTSGFVAAVQQDTSLSPEIKEQITEQSENGVGVVSEDQVKQYVIEQGGTTETAESIASIYQNSQLEALKEALFIVFAVSILSLFLSKNLPSKIA
jgi:MFS family permease